MSLGVGKLHLVHLAPRRSRLRGIS